MARFTLTKIVTLATGEVVLLDEQHAQALFVKRRSESYSSAQWNSLFQAEQVLATDLKTHDLAWEDVPKPTPSEKRKGVLVGGIAF